LILSSWGTEQSDPADRQRSQNGSSLLPHRERQFYQAAEERSLKGKGRRKKGIAGEVWYISRLQPSDEPVQGVPMGRSVWIWSLCLLCLAADARAQYFGRNKVQYDRDDVRVLSTEHFDLYYPADASSAALAAGRLAERWYARLSKTLEHSLSGRQPIILYTSHRTFEQTNVYGGLIDENTGGFTESRKRRIVVPFAASLADTDHVLGHEIVHAFQYDMASRYRTGLDVPLWFIEGMAEYLTLGPDDPLTAMWMRAAAQSEELPSIKQLASPRYFPYRWGAALWSHLIDRFGPDLPAKALRAKRDVSRRLLQTTGETLTALTTSWHDALRQQYGEVPANSSSGGVRPLISSVHGVGRLNLAASLSPDGRRLIFLSERDQFSIDLFLADASTGAVIRKLITTAGSGDFESLQYLHSAGAWDATGEKFALATIRGGRPALTILDVDDDSGADEIALPQLDEAYSPTWAPDGRSVAFSGMKGGFTDLFVVDSATRTLRQLTNDQYADLQPAWSPDGRTLAFTTDRFSTDLTRLRCGSYRLALLDVDSQEIDMAPAVHGANQLDPAWSPDGSSLYFVADPGDVSNVFRLSRSDSRIYQVTHVGTGVSGVTKLSPALSVASRSGTMAFSVFRRDGYEIHTVSSASALAGTLIEPIGASATLADASEDNEIDPVLQLPNVPDPGATRFERKRYQPKLTLEAVGSPYFSAGGGAFGSYVQGGASFLFGDLLGDKQMLTALHLNSRLDESAFGVLYVDRASRWTWGLTGEQSPEIRVTSTSLRVGSSEESTVTRDRERRLWTHRQGGAFVAYPLSRTQRIELSGGVRQIAFDRETRTEVFSSKTGRLLEEHTRALPSDPAVAFAEAGVALVGDRAVFGATGPLLGSRYRFQVSPAFGGLHYTTVLADYRHYVMPIRPYTIAVRLLHSGRYGGDSDDLRLRETFLGSSSLVRGYGVGTVARSECRDGTGDCPALNSLLGTGLLVAKLELRVPLLSAFSSRIRYGVLPMDAFVFADAGTTWGGNQHPFGPLDDGRAVVRSVGAGVRVNAMGLVLEVGTIRPLDLHRAGWSFAFNLRPGF
jgi:Tol biopolymer transport system component